VKVFKGNQVHHRQYLELLLSEGVEEALFPYLQVCDLDFLEVLEEVLVVLVAQVELESQVKGLVVEMEGFKVLAVQMVLQAEAEVQEHQVLTLLQPKLVVLVELDFLIF
jgi:hypothetical protein